jgi:hypothetical protein
VAAAWEAKKLKPVGEGKEAPGKFLDACLMG